MLPLRLALVLPAALILLAAQAPNVAPYYPTPFEVVTKMLEIGELKPGQTHYDLGSGDGRLVIMAARDFQAKSVGFEIDPQLITTSRRQITELGLDNQAEIRSQDLFTVDMSDVDLVTVYLLPAALKKLVPIFKRALKPGARVVSHDFPIENWEPEQTITLDNYTDPDDNWLHTIYLYRQTGPQTAEHQ